MSATLARESVLRLISELNPNQQRAATASEGKILILAGAGSGKTRVLTVRIAYLIIEKGVNPCEIVGLTFTNKAAGEMRDRLAAITSKEIAKQVTLSTFHSFCLNILRKEASAIGYTPKFSIYDEQDVQRVVMSIAQDIIGNSREMPSLGVSMAAIAKARNLGQKADEIVGTGSDWHDQFTRTLFVRMSEAMRAYNAVDFDSMLYLVAELFENHPDILAKYQQKFRYFLIDEYQDTNPIQDKIARLLAAKEGNLCVVGDDDQSIYGWRGASIKNILNFDAELTVRLEQNYRSHSTILEAANAVIGNNTERHAKKLWSSRGEGEKIEVFTAPSEIEEAQAVVGRIVKLKELHGLRWRDFAILYRSNALSRQMEQALLKQNWDQHGRWVRGIPYQIYGGLPFYARKEIKDLIGYLRVVSNPLDEEAILRVINQPRRGIGENSLLRLTDRNRAEKIPLWELLNDPPADINPRCRGGIDRFLAVVAGAKERLANGELAEGVQWLIDSTNYRQAIHDEVKSEKMREFKWENVQELISALREYEIGCAGSENEKEKKPSLDRFLESSSLGIDDQFNKKKNLDDAVSLMTFHSAKGLEFPACFLVGLEQHIIPHERSMKETGIQEERRLMYVAITRAEKFLCLSMAKQRMRMGKTAASRPSQFVLEIPKSVLKVTSWGDA
jgi:superfamily I DNA/RNA helicase